MRTDPSPTMYWIEPFAGTAAVALHAAGASGFPVSRIGSKRGYAAAIVDVLGSPCPSRLVLRDADPMVVSVLAALTDPVTRTGVAAEIERESGPARDVWERARAAVRGGRPTPAQWLVWTAGARGGVGGFKGPHRRRPSVDGFIPALPALAARVRAWTCPIPVDVSVARAEDIDFTAWPPGVVYLDPPYMGTTGYGHVIDRAGVVQTARRAAVAGHVVAVSEAEPIPELGRSINITTRRRGQSRRSMTRSVTEWLTVTAGGRA